MSMICVIMWRNIIYVNEVALTNP